MAVNSTTSWSSSLLTSQESEEQYLLTVADRGGLMASPVWTAGYVGRATNTTRVERKVLGLGADRMVAETEGVGVTGTAIANNKTGATVAGQALARQVTQQLQNLTGRTLTPEELMGFDLAVAATTRILEMVITSGQSATTSTSTTGVDLTLATFMAALAAYRAKGSVGVGAYAPPIFIGYSNSISDLGTDIALNAGGQAQYGDEFRRISALTGGSYAGEWNGIQLWQSQLIPTANAGADSSNLLIGPAAITWADQLPTITKPNDQRILGGATEAGFVPPMLAEVARDALGGVTSTVARIFFGTEYNSVIDMGHKVITDR